MTTESIKTMALSNRPFAYSKMDREDPEEVIHRRAQFLIYQTMKQADFQRRPSFLRVRISKIKVKIGNRLKRLRKRMLSCISAARISIYRRILRQLRELKCLFGRGEVIAQLPPLFK